MTDGSLIGPWGMRHDEGMRHGACGRLIAFACCVSVLTACATVPPHNAALATAIDRAIATPPLDHAVWGIEVEDDSGATLYAHNGHLLMMPASNRKLFSAATDVECLGLSARLTTELWIDGEDVIIRGDGDPSFGSDRHASPGFAPFVAALRARGVTRVRNVIADVSRFDRVTIPGSWKVGNLPSAYAAPVDALAFQENAAGEAAVTDPGMAAAFRFRDELILAGIAADGPAQVNTAPRVWQERVASVQSPVLYQLLTTMLKNSHNLYAEMLFKRSGDGTYGTAEALERQFLTTEAAVDPAEVHFVDGCGLSPEDLVTPAAVVKILRWMNAPGRRGDWWTLLAQPGGEGTLRRRLTDLGPRLRGKTGSINGVNALSGIVMGANGQYRYFSVIINHHLADTGEALDAIDAIAEEIAKF